MDEHQCCEQVFGGIVMGGHRCTRKGTVEVNGKWYCWQHDPERVKREEKKRQEKWKEERERGTAIWDRRLLERRVCLSVTDEELESILGVGGLRGMLGIDTERTISIGWRVRETDDDQ